MSKGSKTQTKQDLSSFMSVLIMTIGCLTILLVANTLIIASNPENVEITSVVRTALDSPDDPEGMGIPFFANKTMYPHYVDVYRDRLIIYPQKEVVLASELDRDGNGFARLLAQVEHNNAAEYIVLLLRPHSADFSRKIKKLIKNRGIRVGQELYEMGREVEYVIGLEDEQPGAQPATGTTAGGQAEGDEAEEAEPDGEEG